MTRRVLTVLTVTLALVLSMASDCGVNACAADSTQAKVLNKCSEDADGLYILRINCSGLSHVTINWDVGAQGEQGELIEPTECKPWSKKVSAKRPQAALVSVSVMDDTRISTRHSTGCSINISGGLLAPVNQERINTPYRQHSVCHVTG